MSEPTPSYDHVAECSSLCLRPPCPNEGIVYDVPSLDGRISQMICGTCGVNFTTNVVPKE
jgi:hypothetical protein